MGTPTDKSTEEVDASMLVMRLLEHFDSYTLTTIAPLEAELERALASERERCAKIADEGARLGDEDGNPDVVAAARIIARKIRNA